MKPASELKQEAQRIAEETRQRAEEEARLRAEAEARLREEEARLQEAQEARARAEVEALRLVQESERVEEEARLRSEAEGRLIAEQQRMLADEQTFSESYATPLEVDASTIEFSSSDFMWVESSSETPVETAEVLLPVEDEVERNDSYFGSAARRNTGESDRRCVCGKGNRRLGR